MSISDGLVQSIFSRNREETSLVKEGLDGKVLYLPAESVTLTSCCHFLRVLFLICTLTWRLKKYVSRQGKLQRGEMKVQKHNYC